MERALAWLLLAMVFEACGWAQGYDQPFRPQMHFSPERHWTNDPNGLVFFRGEYHLFFQFNPFGDEWGHMSWGHAVSADLLHWKELPVAIPEADGTMIFTGSVVVDAKNTSGLCAVGTACLVAIYTGHTTGAEALKRAGAPAGLESLQTQNLAVSQDAGRTWSKFAGNPVLNMHLQDFRDPSVFWDGKRGRWVMAVALPKEHKVEIYGSRDLKRWNKLSEFGPAGYVSGDWECPDLLHVPEASGRGPGMWALKVGLNPGAPQGGSGEQYFLGSFNGTRFVQSSAAGAHGLTNFGKDDYCAISYNGLPKGRRPILMGWMDNWEYAAELSTAPPWRGQMSLAREVSVLRDRAGLALRQEPVLGGVEGPARPISARAGGEPLRAGDVPYELRLSFSGAVLGTAGEAFGVRLRSDAAHWTEIGFDPEQKEFYMDRTHAGLEIGLKFGAVTRAPLVEGRPMDLTLIVDRSSVEAYAQGGTLAMTDLVFAPEGEGEVEVFGPKGVLAHGEERTLASVWRR